MPDMQWKCYENIIYLNGNSNCSKMAMGWHEIKKGKIMIDTSKISKLDQNSIAKGFLIIIKERFEDPKIQDEFNAWLIERNRKNQQRLKVVGG